MGLFQRLLHALTGRSWELAAADDAPAPPPPPVSRDESPAERLGSGDIERVATLPPPPPGAPPIDLRHGVDMTHFSSTILIGLQATLDELAAEATAEEQVFIHYLRKLVTNRSIRLPTIPEAVLRIDQTLRKPNCTIPAVAACVAAEPAIATKLVGIANSPFYAGARRASSIEAAIARLGLHETKNVVQAVAFGSRLFRVPGWEREVERLYYHALVSALAARAIAEQAGLDGDELFMAGLIHDIGRVVVLSTVAELEHLKRSRVPRPLVERVADAVHAELSALVAESWNSTLEVVVGARYHHHPTIIGPQATQRHAHVLHLADGVARALLDRAAAEAGLEAAVDADSVAALAVRPYLVEIVTRTREAARSFDVPLIEGPLELAV